MLYFSHQYDEQAQIMLIMSQSQGRGGLISVSLVNNYHVSRVKIALEVGD